MYAAVAADEISDPFDNDRRVLLSPNKGPHVFERFRSRTDSDYSYKGIELPSLTTNTFSTISDTRNSSKRRRFWQDTKNELKTFQWRKWASRFIAVVLPVILIIVLLLLTIWICIPGALFRTDDVCRPDGNFYVSAHQKPCLGVTRDSALRKTQDHVFGHPPQKGWRAPYPLCLHLFWFS